MISILILITPSHCDQFHLKHIFVEKPNTNTMTKINDIIQFDIINEEKFTVGGFANELLDPLNKQTVLNLAQMSRNAYYFPNSTDIKPVGGWNETDDFGWLNGTVRGYVYLSQTHKEIIIVFKGTDLTGDTSENDKFNDNMIFSCCCGFKTDPVCSCRIPNNSNNSNNSNQCSWECLTRSVFNEPSYVMIGLDIYKSVKSMYPNAIINFAGHSLGGAIASMLMVSTDEIGFAVTFGSPPALHYTQRFMNITNEKIINVFNYGSQLDPLFQGTCNGAGSTCYYAGYMIETKCQLGFKCQYSNSGFEHIGHHRIDNIIYNLESLQNLPRCSHIACEDCVDWDYS